MTRYTVDVHRFSQICLPVINFWQVRWEDAVIGPTADYVCESISSESKAHCTNLSFDMQFKWL